MGGVGGARLAKCVSDNISNNAPINLQPIPSLRILKCNYITSKSQLRKLWHCNFTSEEAAGFAVLFRPSYRTNAKPYICWYYG